MPNLLKFVIGVKPAKRMFRISSLSGEIIDAVIDALGDDVLPDGYYKKVARHLGGSGISLRSDDNQNILAFDSDGVIFTKDYYEDPSHFNFDRVAKEFRQVWQACNGVLKIKDIRRIGMVGEYGLDPQSSNPSHDLLNCLTKFQQQDHAAKFLLQFENRSLTSGATGLPDVTTSDFWNVIETYYDRELDIEHSDSGKMTVSLDVQRYYTPNLNGDVLGEIRLLKRRFDVSYASLRDRLTRLGLIHGAQ